MRMSLAFAAQVSMRSEAAGRPWMDWEVVYPMAWRSGCATRLPRSSGWGTGPPSWSVVEWRRVFEVHGVPHGRPLPDLVEGALVAVCPELVPRSRAKFQARPPSAASSRSSVGTDTRDLRIPVATYLYDQRIALCLHHLASLACLHCSPPWCYDSG